jgi:hypothetical protein
MWFSHFEIGRIKDREEVLSGQAGCTKVIRRRRLSNVTSVGVDDLNILTVPWETKCGF